MQYSLNKLNSITKMTAASHGHHVQTAKMEMTAAKNNGCTERSLAPSDSIHPPWKSNSHHVNNWKTVRFWTSKKSGGIIRPKRSFSKHFLGSSAYQNFVHVGSSPGPRSPPKKTMDLTHFQLKKRSRTTRCRFLQSFAVPDKAVKFQESWGTLRRESVVGCSPPVLVLLLSLLTPRHKNHNNPQQRQHQHATTKTKTRTRTCTCNVCVKVYVYAHMKMFVTFHNSIMFFSISLTFK